jgi:hypothetical protein
MQKMAQESISQMLQSYSPIDLTLPRLFGPLKQHLGGRRYRSSEVEMAVGELLARQEQEHDF